MSTPRTETRAHWFDRPIASIGNVVGLLLAVWTPYLLDGFISGLLWLIGLYLMFRRARP